MNELALFSGTGGGILGGHLLGWRTVCAVEYEPYPASVLITRQNEGLLAPFPIWDDVCTFDGRPWKGHIDVVSGGFPCQDISIAGSGTGLAGKRSGLWGEMSRITREVQPKYVFVENSPMLRSRGLGRVLGDLSEMGYDAEWGCISAADCGAPHKRERIWLLGRNSQWQLADSLCSRHENGQDEVYSTERGVDAQCQLGTSSDKVAYSSSEHEQREQCKFTNKEGWSKQEERQTGSRCNESGWWSVEPTVGRVAHGLADRVDRLKALGNGQVPIVAATAFKILKERLDKHLRV